MFINDTPTTGIYTYVHTLSLHDALPILSVAVVVNYQQDKDGKSEPLSQERMDKIQNLVRRAMGYSAERGDTVSVVNSPFSAAAQDQLPPWKDPYYIGLAMQIGDRKSTRLNSSH